MKKWEKFVFSLTIAVSLISLPAFGAMRAGSQPVMDGTEREWVNMGQGPGEAVWVEDPNGPDPQGPPAFDEGGAPTGEEAPAPSPVIEAGESRQEEAMQAGEENRLAEEAARQAEEARLAEEAARQAEEARLAEEAARQAEEARLAQEAARQAEEARLAEEAARQAEEARLAGGRQVDPSRPMVALTFDDGPQPSVGNRIMDCLAQYGGKATFFLVGDRVAPYASEVQRMVAEGHEVANHSMNHKYLQKLGAAQIQAQVALCNDAIEAACGVRPKIMRLPGGNHNATVRANTHMPMIQWNIDTLDWKTKNAQKTIQSVLGRVKDGDVVLMHELYSQTGDAALQLIPELVNRGYQLVTVSEMAAAKGYPLVAGNLYSSFP